MTMRGDALALMTDGHRIQQTQARMITKMLQKGLEEGGKFQMLELQTAYGANDQSTNSTGTVSAQPVLTIS